MDWLVWGNLVLDCAVAIAVFLCIDHDNDNVRYHEDELLRLKNKINLCKSQHKI